MAVKHETDPRYVVRRDFRITVDGVPITEVHVDRQRHLNPKSSHTDEQIRSTADFVAFNGENTRAVLCGHCFKRRPHIGGSFLGYILDGGDGTTSGLHRRERNRGISGQDRDYWAHDSSQTVVRCQKGHEVACDPRSILQALDKALAQGSEVLWLT